MLDGQALGEARMAVKRKLAKCSPCCFMGLATLSLVIILSLSIGADLMYSSYHIVFDKFLGFWLSIVGLSLFIIMGSRILIIITQNPNTMRQCKTASTTKQFADSLSAILLFVIIIAGIMALWFFSSLVFSGNITKPIYDLMFATAFIVYITSVSYGIWWGKNSYPTNA